MKSLSEYYKLNNGVTIPCIGFGTWKAPNGEVAVSVVKHALLSGYRHIDTAAGYQNEESVGIAVKESGIKREEIFVTSKLQNTAHGYEETLRAFEETRKKLQMDYLDLYLIHWPNPIMVRDHWQKSNAGTWKAMEELYLAGRIRSIGVSNFRKHHLEALYETASTAPMVNQIRLCPGETQDELTSYCRDQNLLLEAYSPLGSGKIFEVPEMIALSVKYGKSIAQICVRWSLQMGFLPLPKSVTNERIEENGNVFDFELSAEDVSVITGLKGCCGYSTNPDTTEF